MGKRDRRRSIEDYERHGREEPSAEALPVAGEGAPPRRRRPIPLELLLVEERFLVVAKPPGIMTVPPRSREARTAVTEAWALLRRRDPMAGKPLVVHRLDRDTTGCLLLARDPEAARDLMEQFRRREVEKTYLALVLGAPQPPAGEVEFRVEPNRRRPGSMDIVRRGGKPCVTRYETVEVFRGLALVRVRPLTGRMHQVRLAMRHLGTPLAVDPLYGGEEGVYLSRWKTGYRTGRGRAEQPLVDRLTLHAETLAFRAPGAAADDPAGRVRVEAPLPRDLEAALRQLRRHAAPGTL